MGGEESEDENYPEGPPEVTNKRKKQLTAGQVLVSSYSLHQVCFAKSKTEVFVDL